MNNHSRNRDPSEHCLVRTSETGAKPGTADKSLGQTDPVEWAVALIESETARLRSNGFGGLNTVLGTQGLALDAMFMQLTREAVEGDGIGYQAIGLALRAQSQSRATLVTLVSRAKPRPAAHAYRARKNLDEQTAANGDSHT
jgi:hypothetical protein